MSRAMLLKPQSGLVNSPDDAERHDAEVAMAKQMAEILQRLYQGHRWATFADSRQGITWVAIPALMGPSLRFVIHIDKMTTYAEMVKELREAGGQILERFKQKRGEFVLHDFDEALKKRITNHVTPMPE